VPSEGRGQLAEDPSGDVAGHDGGRRDGVGSPEFLEGQTNDFLSGWGAVNNLYLTFLCNNRCPYCFLMGKLRHDSAKSTPADHMSLEDARAAADFFAADREVSLLGGEPTLHPEFREIADLFLERGYAIFLFSNGRFGNRIRDYLAASDRTSIVFNVNEPSFYTPGTWDLIQGNLEALQERINSLAVTISRIGQNTDHVIDLVRRHRVRAVKIGLAAPAGSGRNECVPFDQRRNLAGPLVDLVEQLGAEGVITYGECEKLKPCMLDRSMKDRMLAAGWQGAVYINAQCRRGGNIDIAPDLSVWRCLSFPESLGRNLTDFDSPAALRRFSQEAYDRLLFGSYPIPACNDCGYALRRECEGGCMVRKICPDADRPSGVPNGGGG
jgi:MoaA/NifB/PqqE/SkfB family radical SAM enzyme